jgi:hypothetical protein
MDTLLNFCQKWAKENGYSVAKANVEITLLQKAQSAAPLAAAALR